MPYVRRDRTGRIIALSDEPAEGFEQVGEDAPGLKDLESRLGLSRSRLQESDLEVIRVLDDLITVLIDKNIVRFTDLPEPAQRKLIERRGLRESGTHLGLLGDDNALI
jgi:hypothetical protein